MMNLQYPHEASPWNYSVAVCHNHTRDLYSGNNTGAICYKHEASEPFHRATKNALNDAMNVLANDAGFIS